MIISHRHRFIYFAVPKTATQSLRKALAAHLAATDWQQHSLFGHETLPLAELASIGHGHLSLRDLLPHMARHSLQDYYRFAFVRNPFDRFVSTCFFLFRDDGRFPAAASSFMKSALQRPRFRERVLVAPQVSFLLDDEGKVAMNAIGYFESLQESFDDICNRLGVPRSLLGKRNQSRHRHFSEYYDAELADMVREFYRHDFEAFGYSTEP